MDWSENHSCIKCDKGGNVLVCSKNGCPLTVHEGCLGYPAGLDDAGRFRCPYCLYKQAVVETRKAREYALARKKALLIFMDGSEKGVGENGDNLPKSNGANVNITSKSGVIDQGVRISEAEKIGDAPESSAGSKAEDPQVMMNKENGSRAAAEEKRVQEEEREASVEEQIQEEQREASVEEEEEEEEEIQGEKREASVEEEEEEEEIQEEQREASVEDIQEASVEKGEIHERNVKLLSKKLKKRLARKNAKLLQEEEEVQEEQCEASVKEEEIHEEKREASADEEDIEEEESEPLYASNSQDSSFTAKVKRGLKRSKHMEKEPEYARVKSKSLKHHDKKKKPAPPPVSTPTTRSARGSSSTKGTGKALKKELVSPRKSAIPIQISAKPAKRQRLMWSEEEEAALREGVTKYSREEKIPWRKILEESNKFNETRTLEDLRNKWKKRIF